MKVSMAAFSFLILTTVLGSQARVIDETRGLTLSELNIESSDHRFVTGFHQPADCCFSYTQRSIRCSFMKAYFETSSGCSRPAVIFLNKIGKRVCADPSNVKVQDCMKTLGKQPISKNPGTMQLA
ncbi:C-C motif chemokine 15 [Tupaia chinensis]|uniref:C-C motif chemokine 15 n=1 Tax=Tupaia chinensis TaxID=246437 RepID=UPI000704409C|nr:C-C motif chemokine 15 [Tupaia chinensis]